MTQPTSRRAPTLSISLTPKLAAVVANRVESGLYASASELFREALRLLLKVENAEASQLHQRGQTSPLSASRFKSASELQDLGLSMRVERVRRMHPGLSDDEVLRRLEELANEEETGAGLQVSAARLAKLKLDEPG
ncbi:MAG: type II toxin-antitoxin system ParD family antitoxin [Planctomycetota bacterium]